MGKRKKTDKNKFQQHAKLLIWKSYIQRQRRWRILVVETLFAFLMFMAAVFVAEPVFLKPLQEEPEMPLTAAAILNSLDRNNIVGYAPSVWPYTMVMPRVSELLDRTILRARTEEDLNNMLYNMSRGSTISNNVIWVIFHPEEHKWKFTIRSSKRAHDARTSATGMTINPHLRAGFLAVQLAVSQSIVEYVSDGMPNYNLTLVSMPVSPLMIETKVRRVNCFILLFYTLAMMPPILESEAMIVAETVNKFKRALRLRDVGFTSIYVGWLTYAYLSAAPMCLLGSFTLIFIYRWIHLIVALLMFVAYITVMIMMALIQAMFHHKGFIACIWTALFTLLQTFLAELLVQHDFDLRNSVLTFFFHLALPPLGLVYAFDEFALLQTKGDETHHFPVTYMIFAWAFMIAVYFGILMILQRTVGHDRAIGGQLSLKQLLFRKIQDRNSLMQVIPLPVDDRLQEVDELVAKAISFRGVTKINMGVKVLRNISFDIYRGEYTMLFAERIQRQMLLCLEDLLTGLAFADTGTINVLGSYLRPGKNYISRPQMMGYCHRSAFLVPDLTVLEHITLFIELSLWHESRQYLGEYIFLRSKHLLYNYDLYDVQDEYTRHLDEYYLANLCWALAMLLEPRIVLLPNFVACNTYKAVIKDKILSHRKYITIIKLCFSKTQMEFADRLFFFDYKTLVFGGSPAYMFFKHGRDYRLRLYFDSAKASEDERFNALLERAAEFGVKVRSNLGSLLMLQVPANPSENITALIRDLTKNSKRYKLSAMNICVADPEEVCKRAVIESRANTYFNPPEATQSSIDALDKIAQPRIWQRKQSWFLSMEHMKSITSKFYKFHIMHKTFLLITIMSAILTGIFIGLSLAALLTHLREDRENNRYIKGDLLTVESLPHETVLVIRSDNDSAATSIANYYVLSDTYAKKRQISHMVYTAMHTNEDLKEYLVTRAIDSPQDYVLKYSYGLDITEVNDTVIIFGLYSPLNRDFAAAARSLARIYMALVRHYSGQINNTIQVTDNPLTLDLTAWWRQVGTPVLWIQFLLLISISHITLIPSMEHGLIRHIQRHAMDFSPMRYWVALYICDLVFYLILVGIMTSVMLGIIYLVVPPEQFQISDLVIVPIILTVYGIGSIPQAYIFSLGPRAALNSMTFIILNIVFGEATIVTRIFYGSPALTYLLQFMSLSPQFNMAYAYVKIKKIFLYNSECVLFKGQNLCSAKTLHKCCAKCGVLQQCFVRQSYLSTKYGVIMEMMAMLFTSAVFMCILMVWEYRVVHRIWIHWVVQALYPERTFEKLQSIGVIREKRDVIAKVDELNSILQARKHIKFGERLLASKVSKKEMGMYTVQNVSLGVASGEVVGIAGLKAHGRLKLCELLAGYKLPCEGQLINMSKYKVSASPHKYAHNTSLSCQLREVAPQWLSVHDGLRLLAILRGVPEEDVDEELWMYLDALELRDDAHSIYETAPMHVRTRVHFLAAVIGAPPIIVLDECTAYQWSSVRRAMYFILNQLRNRGHAIVICDSKVENVLPVTARLAIIVDGYIFDIDTVDNLVERYTQAGFIVVVHLKDEVDVERMFQKYFTTFTINDTSEVLVSLQVQDYDLDLLGVFERMEALKEANNEVYSYIVTSIPVDYIYNTTLANQAGLEKAHDLLWKNRMRRAENIRIRYPKPEALNALKSFKQRYSITTLKQLPWSVIFNR